MRRTCTVVKLFAMLFAGLLVMSWVGCDGSLPGSTDEGTVTIKMQADYGDVGAASRVRKDAITTCPDAVPDMDDHTYAAGLDCDGDGGVVQFITPSSFKVALKYLAFVNAVGEDIVIVSDTGTLAESEVQDLAEQITLDQAELPLGYYPSYVAEVYYYELIMPINDPSAEQTIRVYLSDDDFDAEGNLGHHQGDITLLDEDGVELGWAGATNDPWEPGFLQATRGDIYGAGGTDPETGHLRGLCGDEADWNRSECMQGSEQDIHVMEGPLDLMIADDQAIVTFTFDVTDCWYFEDFDGDGLFDPCQDNLDACGETSEWGPIFNAPDVAIE